MKKGDRVVIDRREELHERQAMGIPREKNAAPLQSIQLQTACEEKELFRMAK